MLKLALELVLVVRLEWGKALELTQVLGLVLE